ncbi:PLDc N-terminal domain-containing protein [Rathayibacter rathayi]|uniref:Cardiolipin synthase N-terminal domain-containing protein n=1 Tax=Rathayibacter rathayi TaxID=33887 RepID=A0ABD6WBN7_RATRA|nr:PLDc N-terminal domain-containing protein [Rathayibacter rathayi]AZZ48430.1 hypothetical protein C1O28_03795 [Rathayibacter rathayi]MWV74340.1 hypothetical protein [Rathayibacter rathayi NCPPB 2980 = VKM Ac-1601]PPF15922.1 hypothetical protein C5C04_01510 [Rathayibacter rathayi]PPF78833.1 hypothetical protein C5C14_10610 [Rathayibacter rathayi]PPG12004.1 hypothetical protein C5C11_10855 [Rathayibacter rathayi]
MKIEILLPVLLLGLAFLIYCYVDLIRSTGTRYLPKWAWAIICAISIPLGGILYLIFGRTEQRAAQ